MKSSAPKNNQVVGNSGLYYVCYRLSRLGWNVMPTARNARGIDVLIYSQDATRTHTIQVKALSQRSPVPLGTKLEALFGDFFVICRNLALDTPECFILTPAEVRSLAHKGAQGHQGQFLASAEAVRDCRVPRAVGPHRKRFFYHASPEMNRRSTRRCI